MGKRINTAKWSEKYQRWQINVQKDGVRRSFYSSVKGRNGQREANRKADNWLESSITNDNQTVEKLSIQFIEYQSLRVGKSRQENIKSHFKLYINKLIGNKKIANLTEQDLQNVLDFMYKKGKGYSYIDEVKRTILPFMKFLRKNKITTLNPEFLEVNPKARRKDKKGTLQPKDIYTLFRSPYTLLYGEKTKDIFIYAYRFAVVTGLRRGELLGLKWSDILRDINGSTIVYVNRAVNEFGEITQGKTDNAKRSFILPQIAVEILEEQNIQQTCKSPYIFTDKYNERIRPQQLTARFRIYANYNKLSRHTLHELRHTFISLNKDNLSLSLLKDFVGHSPNMKTLSIYGHSIENETLEASKLINDRFNEILNKKNNY
ncbi:tyrosine-type recombinase/integrase [Anaerofustis stercorihominis]|uniref:tyrosine-type recombinase/integrase n=1 Tax=Anaerofustis stercorihominis TaxID=214853 RepID=UPI0026731144|nr:tyrosine-type recombinase/integrase [Anaerofustis stercorihominis]